MTKVLFFMAGEQPTVDEANALAALNAQRFDVEVRNVKLLVPGQVEECDAVAGAVPDAYEDLQIFDGLIPPGGAAVVDGDSLTVRNSQADVSVVATAHVLDAHVSNVQLPATHALVTTGLLAGITVTGTGTKLTLTVTNGKISAAALSA
jgi:hypothetical protein